MYETVVQGYDSLRLVELVKMNKEYFNEKGFTLFGGNVNGDGNEVIRSTNGRVPTTLSITAGDRRVELVDVSEWSDEKVEHEIDLILNLLRGFFTEPVITTRRD